MAPLSDEKIEEMHESWIEIRKTVEDLVPSVKEVARDVRVLQDAQLQEQSRIDAAASKAVAAYAGRKGQKVRDWMPLLVAIVTSGLIFAGTLLSQPTEKAITSQELKAAIQDILKDDNP